jgi:hypothetical protein
VAAATPPAQRRSLLWVLVAIGLVLAVAVVSLLVVVLVRQPASPTVAATPTPTPNATATPAPGTSGSGEPSSSATSQEQHQQYRAYVSTLVQGGTAVIADIFGLVGCRDGRPECASRLNDASNQVTTLQKDLAANPTPSCLAEADARLQDSLTFQQKGLDTARNAVLSQNRIRLVQGLLLTAVGLWRGGQAIADGRNADC